MDVETLSNASETEAGAENASTSEETSNFASAEETGLSAEENGSETLEAETTESDDAEGESSTEIELPRQQMKAYDDTLRDSYARRFGWSLDDLAADADKSHVVKKAIDSDIYIQQLESQLADQKASDTEADADDTAAETEAAAEKPLTPEAQQTQYQEFVSQVAGMADPKAVAAFGESVAKAFIGVDPATVKDPAERAQLEAFLQRGGELGKVMARGFVDLAGTVMPAIIGQVIEAAYPGFQQEQAVRLHSSAFSRARAKVESDPEFPKDALTKVPAYGSKAGDFGKWVEQTSAKIPGFAKLRFDGMSPQEAIAAKYELLFRYSAGQRITSAVVRQAAETAKNEVKVMADRKRAAAALGSGKSRNQLTSPDESPLAKGHRLWQERDSSGL